MYAANTGREPMSAAFRGLGASISDPDVTAGAWGELASTLVPRRAAYCDSGGSQHVQRGVSGDTKRMHG